MKPILADHGARRRQVVTRCGRRRHNARKTDSEPAVALQMGRSSSGGGKRVDRAVRNIAEYKFIQ